MNENIARIAGNALDKAVPETWTLLTPNQLKKFTEVFAQMLVQEACRVVSENPNIGTSLAASRMADHFGVCQRCGKDHSNDEPLNYEDAVRESADEMAKAIDMEALKLMGAWIDDDKDYTIGTRDKYEEFVKKRNYTYGK